MFFSFWVLELDFPVFIEILREQNFAKGGTRNVYSRKNRCLKMEKRLQQNTMIRGMKCFKKIAKGR